MVSMAIVLAAAGGSFLSGLDPAWIAFLGAAFGGAGLKITEHWLGRNRVRVDDASQIRDELRQEITSQREEIRALEAEVHKWREEYYALRDKYMTLQLEMLQKVENIKQEVAAAEKSAEKINSLPPTTPPAPVEKDPLTDPDGA